MADSKLSALAVAGAIDPADLLYLSQSGVDKKLPFSAIGVDDLNDFEKGNWTATAADASSGGNTSTTTGGTYTKIGNRVTIFMSSLTNIDTTPLTGGNEFHIQGLPFTPTSEIVSGSINLDTVTFSGYVTARLAAGVATALVLRDMVSGATDISVLVSSFTDGVSDVQGLFISYETA